MPYMSVFELPKVTLIPNGIHHPPIEDGRLLPKSVKFIHIHSLYPTDIFYYQPPHLCDGDSTK